MSGAVGFAAAPLKAKRGKASCAQDCERLEQLPNIGPATASDLRLMRITESQQLRGEDA